MGHSRSRRSRSLRSLRRAGARRALQLLPVALVLLLISGCLGSERQTSQRWQPTLDVEKLRRENTFEKMKRPESWKVRRAIACNYDLKNCRVPDEHERIFGSR